MNLNRYIIASIFFHFIFITLLTITHTLQDSDMPVFSIRIIEPPRTQTIDLSSQEVTERVRTKKPIPRKKRHTPPPEKDAESLVSTPDRSEPVKASRPPDTIAKSRRSGTEASGSLDEPAQQDEIKGQGGAVTGSGDEVGSGQNGIDIQEEEAEGRPERVDRVISESDTKEARPAPRDETKLYPHTFLFDRETIERFAKRRATDRNRGLTFNAPEFRHRGYMRMLKQKIESIWAYPKEAIRHGLSGDLFIRFSIKRDGSLGDIELIRTSGYRSLDEAAIKAIRDAQPFWPLPEDWKGNALVINGHFIYILGRTIIM